MTLLTYAAPDCNGSDWLGDRRASRRPAKNLPVTQSDFPFFILIQDTSIVGELEDVLTVLITHLVLLCYVIRDHGIYEGAVMGWAEARRGCFILTDSCYITHFTQPPRRWSMLTEVSFGLRRLVAEC